LRDSIKAASGRFVLRLKPGHHAALKRAAQESGLSLNEYCARRLGSPEAVRSMPDQCSAIDRALGALGKTLIGVAVYGSWARGEATEQSDVDLLVVLERSTRLTRELYRTWDQHEVVWANLPVEAHFAHLPEAGERVSGLWGELALDGIVIFEYDFQISKQLVRIRRDIVSGRIARHVSHGQVYWVAHETA
jgi:hypothetical protein